MTRQTRTPGFPSHTVLALVLALSGACANDIEDFEDTDAGDGELGR